MNALERWDEEKQSAWLYRVVARHERDAGRRRMFTALAETADRQAEILARDVVTEGAVLPAAFRPSLRALLAALVVSAFGPRRVRPLLAAMKVRGLSAYSGAAVAGHPMPRSVEDIDVRSPAGGAFNLRAAVFGVNDGLVSNTSLVMGMAGAAGDEKVVLLAGFAGLLAGAFSMAGGEYVSVRSQREMYEFQIEQERDELDRYPLEEAEELAVIYAARGVPIDEGRRMARHLVADPEQALATLAREELGVNPADLGSPFAAAASSFVAFAIGAAVPVLPFVAMHGGGRVEASAMLSAASLFGVGMALSLFSGRRALAGGLRMLLIGGAAAAATYGLGRLLGLQLS